MLGLQYCTRGRAARAGVDHTAGGMAEAPAHTEELLDRRAVEVSGCHGPRGGKDFVKSMKPSRLGGTGEAPPLLYVRERSGIMALPWSGGRGGVYHA